MDAATDIRLCVDGGYHDRVVGRREVDNAYYATSTGHTHIDAYTVCGAFVYRYQIIGVGDRVANYLCRNKPERLQDFHTRCVCPCRVFRDIVKTIGELPDLLFQIEITLSKFLIDLAQRKEILYSRVPGIYLPCYRVGRSKPYTALVAVVLKQQHQADNFQ